MDVSVKSKHGLGCFFSKKVLLFVSLLFMVVLVFSPFISLVNGWEVVDVYVYSEDGLRDAISAAPDNTYYRIFIGKELVIEKPLEIPEGKLIYLGSIGRLVGANGADTIIVKSGGMLSLWDGIVVTHADGDSGRGVYVEHGGTLELFGGGEISGNTINGRGGGVYNEGTFDMYWEINARDGKIYGNTATEGGGVYNVGTFTMYGGVISENICVDTETSIGVGGGVYNAGTFSVSDGYISSNMATRGGGVYNAGSFVVTEGYIVRGNTAISGEGDDVFVDDSSVRAFYLLAIVITVVIVGVVAGLFFWCSKKQKHLVTKSS